MKVFVILWLFNYPVIIGNMQGARLMLPDPDWKVDDQPEVRARTSGDNDKNKDMDYDQGSDISTLIFQWKSN